MEAFTASTQIASLSTAEIKEYRSIHFTPYAAERQKTMQFFLEKLGSQTKGD